MEQKLLHDELQDLELFVELELEEQHLRLLSECLLQDELDENEGFEELLLDDTKDGGELQESELLLL